MSIHGEHFLSLASALLPVGLVALAGILNQKAVTPKYQVAYAEAPRAAGGTTLLEQTVYRNVAVTNFIEKTLVWTVCVTEISSIAITRWCSPSSPSTVSRIAFHVLFTAGGHPERIWQFNEPSSCLLILGPALIIAGSIIRLICFETMGAMFTFQHTVKKNHQLVTTGPYSIVRHPSYIGMIMILFGTSLWQAASGSWFMESGYLHTVLGSIYAGANGLWLGTLIVAFVLRCGEEDASLSQVFGEQWYTWAKRVPYKLLPGVF